jgi:hypothetical protein
VLVTIMGSVGYQSAYATDIVAVQRVFYNQTHNFSYQVRTSPARFHAGDADTAHDAPISGWFAGTHPQRVAALTGLWPDRHEHPAHRILDRRHRAPLPRRAAVHDLAREPGAVRALQHAALAELRRRRHPWRPEPRALLRLCVTTDSQTTVSDIFADAFTGGVVWYLFPGYLFQALGYFSWVCWIAPNNVPVNQMFGYVSGLGMSLVTFDWSQIAYIGSPLATPWWAAANVGAGFVVSRGAFRIYIARP